MAKQAQFLLKQQPRLFDHLLAREVRPEAHRKFREEPLVDVDDIQGDALLGFNKPFLALLAFDTADDSPSTLAGVKKWLGDHVVPRLTSTRDVSQFRQMYRLMRVQRGGCKPTAVAQVCCNVSFSYDALLKLAPPEADVALFDKAKAQSVAFKVGLPNRSEYLGDPTKGIGAMKNWKVGAEKNPQILLQIASDRNSLIEEEIDSLKKEIAALGDPVKVTYQETGKRRTDLPGHEHFGFLDGISNLGPRGIYTCTTEVGLKNVYLTPRFLHDEDPRSDLYGLPGQRLIWPGEVVLGLPKQNDDTTKPYQANRAGSSSFTGPDWAKNGTFLVFRRLRQDVPKFWKFMKASAEAICKHPEMEDFSDEHMGAKVISRWKSGAPIIREPRADNPQLGAGRLSNNAFQYVTDDEGYKLKPHGQTDEYPEGDPDPFGTVCPLSSHIRKVHPRDTSTDIGNSYNTLKRLIVRRGIQYGDPIKDVYQDDGVDRGLIFVCYQASIDKQFEFLITQWANSDTNPHNGGGHDMVIGQNGDKGQNRERKFEVPLAEGSVETLKTTDEWVIPTGGGYFFVPSISAVKNVIAKL